MDSAAPALQPQAGWLPGPALWLSWSPHAAPHMEAGGRAGSGSWGGLQTLLSLVTVSTEPSSPPCSQSGPLFPGPGKGIL